MGAAGFELNRTDDLVTPFLEESAALGPLRPGICYQLAINIDLGKTGRIDADAMDTADLGRELAADAGGEMQRIDLAVGDVPDPEGLRLVLGTDMHRFAR